MRLLEHTPEAKAARHQFLTLLDQGNSESTAAVMCGISARDYKAATRGTVRREHARLARAFRASVRRAKARAKARMELRVYQAALRDPELALEWLKARYPWDWNPEVVVRAMIGLKAEDMQPALPTVSVSRDVTLFTSEDDDELEP